MKNPIVSIVTPVFNTAPEYIKELHRSLCQQTLSNFEWNIIDDGSSDTNTISFLALLSATDSRIRIIKHQENKGLPFARNTGIKNSDCKYLFFIDADDYIDNTTIEKCLLVLKSNDALSFVNTYVTGFGSQQYKWTGGFHDGILFLEENRNTSCFMARKNVFDRIVFDENMRAGCEDWDFWLQAASKDMWGYTIPEFLFFYRRSASSTWTTLSTTKKLELQKKELQKKYKKHLTANNFPKKQLKGYTFFSFKDINCSSVNIKPDESKKHILFIFPWLQIGGADYFNLRLLKGLKDKEWSFSIITTNKSNNQLQHEFLQLTEDIFHLPNLGNHACFRDYITYFIETRKPTLLFLSNSVFGYYSLPWLKQKFPDVPIVDYIHSEDPGWYNGGYPFFSAIYNHFLDESYVSSNHLKNVCISNGASSQKIHTKYINVDTDTIKKNITKRNEIRKLLGVGNHETLLIYVARLTKQKQPDVLLKTIASLNNLNLSFKCIIIGDGPDRDEVIRGIDANKLHDKVFYLGELPNTDVLNYMDAADIFFLPSLYEGIALSIYEAMAKELSVVGALTGGQRELVSEDCGYLVSETDTQKQVEEYTRILSNLIQNEEQRVEYGKNARKQVVQNFQLDSLINSIHNSISAVKANKSTEGAYGIAYTGIFEQMLHLEEENKILRNQLNTKAIQFLVRNDNYYRKIIRFLKKVKPQYKRK